LDRPLGGNVHLSGTSSRNEIGDATRTATQEAGAMVETISRDEVKAMMDRGDNFFLVEALDERHYRRSHLPGAINLPPKALDRAEELLPDKEATIVVYCSSPR